MSTSDAEGSERSRLVEEREYLLRSLEDLEREHDVGDMGDDDYETLRAGYTTRAAEVIRAIEERSDPPRPREESSAQPSRSTRTWLVGAAVLVFAVLAGVLVALGSGQRGGGAITGEVGTLRARLATCQTTSFQDPPAGIDCYDDILADAPDNVEALTYQGWAMIRDDRIDEGAANFARVVEIDPDYPDVRVFRAVVASRAGDVDVAAAEIDAFYRNDPPPAAIQVLQSQGLEREIFVQSLDETTRSCWVDAADTQSDDAESQDAQAFLDALGACLDEVIASAPDNVDALTSRVYSLVGPTTQDLSAATAMAQRALDADPLDANALLLHGSLAVSNGELDAAREDLNALEGVQRPTMSFLVGGPEVLADALRQSDVDSPSETTADDPIPNRDGG